MRLRPAMPGRVNDRIMAGQKHLCWSADDLQVADVAGRKAEGAGRKAIRALRIPVCVLGPAPLRFMILSWHDSVGTYLLKLW